MSVLTAAKLYYSNTDLAFISVLTEAELHRWGIMSVLTAAKLYYSNTDLAFISVLTAAELHCVSCHSIILLYTVNLSV